MEFYHSAKGTKWKSHKYIAIKNGRYIYPSKRQASKSRKRIKQLVSESPNIVRDSSGKTGLQDSRTFMSSAGKIASEVRKIGGSVSDTPIEKYLASARSAIDDLKIFADDEAKKAAVRNATEKAQRAGENAINQILGTNFKLTGIIDMEGRGLKKKTRVELGEIKYGK